MKKTKILSILLTLCMLTLLAAGCGTEEVTTDSGSQEIADSSNSSTGSDTSMVLESDDTSDSSSGETTIEEAVIYDANDIVITAVEYTTDSVWGDGIKLLIENNSSQNITVSSYAIIVNDFMVSDYFYSDVAAGKKANETMTFGSVDLNESGIVNIGKIEVYFDIYDTDTYDTIEYTDCLTILTNKYDSMDTVADDSGTVLYDENGIKIIGKYVDDSSYWGTAIMLYCENNSGSNVMISAEDFSINGYMISSYFYETVFDGKKDYADLTIYESDLEDNGITSLDEIAFIFVISDADTYETIAESDEIILSIE